MKRFSAKRLTPISRGLEGVKCQVLNLSYLIIYCYDAQELGKSWARALYVMAFVVDTKTYCSVYKMPEAQIRNIANIYNVLSYSDLPKKGNRVLTRIQTFSSTRVSLGFIKEGR